MWLIDALLVVFSRIAISHITGGIMAVVAIGTLEPANLAVLFELRKPVPNGALISRLMKWFIYAAGGDRGIARCHTGDHDQVGFLVSGADAVAEEV